MKSSINNMTQGNPAKLILAFTIPLLIGNIFQQVYSMADTLIVGQTLGVMALGAVGCTGGISFLILGFAMGLTSGLTIVTAQKLGANDEAGVRRSFVAGGLICIAVTVILTAISVPLTRTILEVMETPQKMIEDAYDYLVVIMWGIGASMLFNYLSNIIRALGDSKTPLYFLIIACVINIALDFLFIMAFKWGVMGAGVATVISQLLSGVMCFIYMMKKFPILRLTRKDIRVDIASLGAHCKMGFPMAFQMSIIAIGTIVVQLVLNRLGDVSVSAYTAAQKLDTIAVQPMSSFGIGMATYVGQNYGAGDIGRIKKGVLQCSVMSVAFSIAIALILILAGEPLVGLFINSGEAADVRAEVIELAQVYLISNGAFYFILALLFIFRYALQGLGNSLVPTVAGVMELIMRILSALFLTESIGFLGACLSNPLAWLGAVLPLIPAYFIIVHKLIGASRGLPKLSGAEPPIYSETEEKADENGY